MRKPPRTPNDADHCAGGHRKTPETIGKNAKGHFFCKACTAEWHAARRKREKAAKAQAAKERGADALKTLAARRAKESAARQSRGKGHRINFERVECACQHTPQGRERGCRLCGWSGYLLERRERGTPKTAHQPTPQTLTP